MPTAICAIFSRMSPKSAMLLLKALRCLAYEIAFCSEVRAPPTHPAPSLKRPTFRMLKAMMCPLPISPRTFSTGTWQSFRMSGAVEEPRMPIFFSDGEAGEIFLDQERSELFTIDLGENGEQVGEVGVGDPHLFTIEDVVLAVGREHSFGAAVQRIGAAGTFRQRVG